MGLEKKCKVCGSPLELSTHGNRSYCDGGDCYYLAKKNRTREYYWRQKSKLKSSSKSDEILKMFYSIYGSDKLIPSKIIDDAGMDWGVCVGMTKIDQFNVKFVGEYGYSLLENNTVRLWKIQNK